MLEMLLPEQLPEPEEFDPFSCQVSFRLIVCESVEQIRKVFQYVEDQIILLPITRELLTTPTEPELALPEADIYGEELPPPPVSAPEAAEERREPPVTEQKKGRNQLYQG